MTYQLTFPESYVKPKLLRRDRWVEALRSGEYQQGPGFLKRNGRYCCLGVLAEIERVLPREIASCLPPIAPQYQELCSCGDFPEGVNVDGDSYSLACCNDTGLNFHQIAEIICAVWENDDEPAGQP